MIYFFWTAHHCVTHCGFDYLICVWVSIFSSSRKNNKVESSKNSICPQLQFFLKFELIFSNFSCMFLNPNIFSDLNSNCYNSLDLRNLQEYVKNILFQKVWKQIFFGRAIFQTYLDQMGELSISENIRS